jgi:hypothetical protein
VKLIIDCPTLRPDDLADLMRALHPDLHPHPLVSNVSLCFDLESFPIDGVEPLP